jgi:glycosyltransferase involved in cell wall biosynthesis
MAAQAAAVTMDSAAVRDDVRQAWALDPGRLHVVQPGPGLPSRSVAGDAADVAVPAPRGAPRPRPYLLAVGALEPRKAPGVLAEAYRRAVAGGLVADLVVVGAGRLEGVLRDVPGIRLAGAVGDTELEALYAGALALVHPALMEGFGLPPLEAGLRGVPTAGSDLPQLRETLGDAALLVPPGDAGALAAALVRLGADPGLRARLGAAARERAAAFTWERTAAALLGVLREAAR